MPAVQLKDLCLDARDPALVARFWADALGLEARPHHRSGVVGVWFHDVPVLWINQVDQPKVGKNRVHLDLRVPEVDRLVELGASVLAEHQDWTVLADPEGNELCAFGPGAFGPGAFDLRADDLDPSDSGPGEAAARPFALCVDSDRPADVAAWWAARTGARLGPGPDGAPRWLHGLAWGPYEIIWKFVPVPDERVAENRLHWDMIGDPEPLTAAGATVLRSPGGDIDWTVLHDPQRNRFCAFPPH